MMSDLPRLPLNLGLLGFLRERPRHGYEIHQVLTETPELRRIWRVKQGRLYAMLARLEEEGLLRATLEAPTNRPPRKMLYLTPAGERAFEAWLAEPVALPREMRLEFMLKLYFAMQAGPEAAGRLIARQRAVCDEWLATQAAEPDSPFLRAVVAYRRAHIAAIGKWLEGVGEWGGGIGDWRVGDSGESPYNTQPT